MLVYHRTDDGTPILRDGFRDNLYIDWVAVASTEEHARVVLELDIPPALMDTHAVIPPPLRGYHGVLVTTVADRAAIIPAAKLNEHRNTIRVLSDAQLQELAVRRRRAWQKAWGLTGPSEPHEEY